ncbi:hypothetical protein E3N88_30762 [Mikania micrantha]|uniref:Uncharacterized protein n=1 Tax=Mikania micrantha TaxID=192012 RepID=A0A5N6MN47_9ASTR|nr:hypothetical protein E3N88_30762 [Mikania micrantha]
MAHSSSKNTTDQHAKIGKETFDAIGSKQLVFHYHQYQIHQAKANHVVQQQVYNTARMTERVITSDEAARMYGGSITNPSSRPSMLGDERFPSPERENGDASGNSSGCGSDVWLDVENWDQI